MSKLFAGLLMFVPALLLAGCTSSSPTASYSNPATLTGSSSSPAPNTSAGQTYTATQVASHNSPNSCWLVINNQIYDVTSYIPNHPGGPQIAQGCGQDITSYMQNSHRPVDYMLPQFLIGTVKP
jgi:cytochrome b involved in lipid metabolism